MKAEIGILIAQLARPSPLLTLPHMVIQMEAAMATLTVGVTQEIHSKKLRMHVKAKVLAVETPITEYSETHAAELIKVSESK
jgi:hypothetical protein